MGKSTHPGRNDKPAKPYPEFPLFPHAAGVWAKKIRGKMHYFGPWEDPNGALAKYLDQKDDLYAGRKPRASSEGLTVADLCNRFLASKRHQLDMQELSPRTFADYRAACKIIVGAFGRTRSITDLRPEDFEQLKMGFPRTWGLTRRGNTIQSIRCVFRYAADEDLVDKVIKFGKLFKRASKKAFRVQRASSQAAVGKRMFEPEQIRSLVQGALIVGEDGPELVRANLQLRTMILLGINCGFGNNDVSTLPRSALDLDGGWVEHPRPKTGIERRCPLWPETVAVLREVLAQRPTPKDATHEPLVFLTKYGLPWVKAATEEQPDGTVKVKLDDAISKEMAKLLKTLKLTRPGLNFYALRHTFETIGGAARDQVAVDQIMGHADTSMAAAYREGISDGRLEAVTDHVHDWLFPPVKA